jgi:hypothetical protein
LGIKYKMRQKEPRERGRERDHFMEREQNHGAAQPLVAETKLVPSEVKQKVSYTHTGCVERARRAHIQHT